MSKRPVIVTVGFTSLIADPLSEADMRALLASRITERPDAAHAAEALDAHCRTIDGLTVHGVGIGDGALYVYCRAKRNAQRLIPKTFEGHAVKYVLCKVTPSEATR